jgi:RNA polymerase subunit RPABC4/transcription elongation factor Spt4
MYLVLVALNPGPPFGALAERFLLFVPLIMVFIVWIGEVRLRARARRASFRLCEHCLYDLSMSSEAGACPECGAEYSYEALARRWKGMYLFHEAG